MHLLNLLKSHVSKDETRYHLTGAYFNEGKAIATDGHRMVVIDTVDCDCAELRSLASLRNNQVHDFKSPLEPITGTYPNYKQFLPDVTLTDKNDNLVHTEIKQEFPLWFKGIKVKKGENAKHIFIDKNGLHITKPQDGYVAVNAEYLAPYAGQDCSIYIKDKLSPIVIIGHHQPNQKWTAVVMPMRV